MTPLAINIMIECYCSGTNPGVNFNQAVWNSPAAKEERVYLAELGLIEHGSHAITPLGVNYIQALTATPVPDTVVSSEAIVERDACWNAVTSFIKAGPLDEPAHSERNGLILAANLIKARGTTS